MAADLLPIRLSLTAGDRYTLWAPRWRDGADEWEAFLGKDEDLYGFDSVADLVAFVRTDRDNDLTDHPKWAALTEANAHRLDPGKNYRFDLVAVEEWLAEDPTKKSVRALAGALAVVSSIGSVCELAPVTRFFNGNPSLGTVTSGFDHFSGRAGLARWHAIGEVISRNWDTVLDAIDALVTTPQVDSAAAGRAADELAEPAPAEAEADEEPDVEDVVEQVETETAPAAEARAAADTVVLGSDEDFWGKVGIDPIQIMTAAGTFYTLRCYFDDRPLFLGRNGRVSVFTSERALARYLADEHDHDLSNLSTYEDIRTAATDGSLEVAITENNVYVLTGIADDLADGPEAIDRDQLELAVELLRDVGDYAEDDVIDKTLADGQPLGKLVSRVLDADAGRTLSGPFAEAVKQWEKLERFVESRLRRE
ncbi:protein export chaperone SatS [Mycolicibacillus trivialis]|uniref:Primosomal protein n=1 Tax=Mycolicibacillus trivialis TaxID=1798 RepID=A0A1X2EKX9_9MYCO|nr:primosomal protein [Mycolicibacillus trivialis]ORX05498.1 primosomal protein [Mycolicibacillus trivialis]